MPKLIGLMCALAALAAGVIAKTDPATAIMRALIAFIAGTMLTQVWYVFFAARVTTASRAPETDSEEEKAA
ncbi:MAG: hypothetical protein IH851_03075 [Armatimonadetes bacterium]|nr:hypothetical protein [Armatimonadota bacterium]